MTVKEIRRIARNKIAQVNAYLEQKGKKRYFAVYPEWKELCFNQEEVCQTEEKKKNPFYSQIVFLLGGTKIAESLLDLALAVYFYPKFGAVLKECFGYMATIEMACQLEEGEEVFYQEQSGLYNQSSIILEYDKKGPFLYTTFYVDNRLIGYLCGDRNVDRRLLGIAELFLPERELGPIFIRKEIYRQIKEILQEKQNVVLLKGERGIGKKFLLSHALKDCGYGVVFASVPMIFKKRQDGMAIIRLIVREALLYSCGICLYDITNENLKKSEITVKEFLQQVKGIIGSFPIPVYFCMEKDVEILPYLSVPAAQFTFDALDRKERIEMWEGYSSLYQLKLDGVLLGSKYKFTPDEIKKACIQLKAREKGGRLEEGQIAMVLGEILPLVQTRGRIEPWHPNCSLDNLVLPEETKRKIEEACLRIWHSYQVYNQWNMESKFAYGKAVSILLSGPPGTGKTMAARVIADRLKLPLYHVNLSQLVDKYIGETEKHLEEIFLNTERGNIILFFDEADAIFSKRSDITDAKDKHANTEVSYILQRLESYDGIVVLSTNYKGNIDKAFIRRMQIVISFHLPDKKERHMLWERCFPEETPKEGIDFIYLAEQFELNGSEIKNIVLTAAFLAAEEGKPVCMKHIINGIKSEYRKIEKPIIIGEFGKYAYLL